MRFLYSAEYWRRLALTTTSGSGIVLASPGATLRSASLRSASLRSAPGEAKTTEGGGTPFTDFFMSISLSALYTKPRKGRRLTDLGTEGRRVSLTPRDRWAGVSIHAAREGGDHVVGRSGWLGNVSIHAAREGGDKIETDIASLYSFQSTPPARAATLRRHRRQSRLRCFNPRRPRGRRRSGNKQYGCSSRIQSTPPARAAGPTGPRVGRLEAPVVGQTRRRAPGTPQPFPSEQNGPFQSTPPAR